MLLCLGAITILCVIIIYTVRYISKNIDRHSERINRLLERHCSACPPVFDPADFAWTQAFRDGWARVHGEFLRYTETRSAPAYSAINPFQSSCNLNGGWNTIFLRAFGADTDIVEDFPETMRLVRGAPCTLAFFSILEPGARLAPHEGVYKGVIRYHLGLEVPDDRQNCFIEIGGERLHWREGENLMFDDRFTHHVQNNTDQRRVILFLDIKRDFNNVFVNLLNTVLLRVIRSNDIVASTVRNANAHHAQLK